MLVLQNLSLFERNCRVLEIFPLLHFKWSKTTKQIKNEEIGEMRSSFKTNSRIKLYLHTVYTISLIVQTLLSRSTGNLTTAEKLVDMTGITCIVSSQIYLRVFLKKHRELALFVNWIFEQRQHDFHSARNGDVNKIKYFYKFGCTWLNYSISIEKGGLVERLNVLLAVTLSSIISTFWLTFVIGMHLLNPCKPGLAGYWLLPQCSWTCAKVEIHDFERFKAVISGLGKVALLCFNTWVVCVGAFPTTFMINNIQVLSTMTIKSLLIRFHRCGTTNVDSLLSYYRQLQILGKLSNDIQKGMVTLLFVVATLIQPFSIVNLLTTHWSKNGLSFATCFSVTIVMQSFLIFIGYGGGLAGIYRESKVALRTISNRILHRNGRRTSRCTRALQLKILKTCTYIKIRFGSLNYVEELTPLKCLDLCNQLTINLLLLTKR